MTPPQANAPPVNAPSTNRCGLSRKGVLGTSAAALIFVVAAGFAIAYIISSSGKQDMLAADAVSLAHFNTMPVENCTHYVSVWTDVPWWIGAIVSARPYSSLASLIEKAKKEAEKWTIQEIDTAIATHAPVGVKTPGADLESKSSTREQSAMETASTDTAAALARGNEEYTKKFHRVFMIRMAGRTPEELLKEQTRRMNNDPETEARETMHEVWEIAELRIKAHVYE